MKSRITTIALLGMALFCVPLFGSVPAGPGTLNYLEGSASLSGRQLQSNDIGTSTMQPGQVLTTRDGRAEILLTPGAFLRAGENTSVKMLSSAMTATRIELIDGEAGIEVNQIGPDETIAVVANGVTTNLVKRGFYEFFTDHPRVMVFTGQAEVEVRPGTFKQVDRNHQMALVPGNNQISSFDPSQSHDPLFQWSKSRSDYLTSQNRAQEYAGSGWGMGPYARGYGFWGGPYWRPFGWGMGYYPGYYPGWWGGYWSPYGPYFGGPGFFVIPR